MQWNLIRLRKEAGLTQPDMAKILGISVTTYSSRERNVFPFEADEMFALSDYFGKSLDEIFLPRNCNIIATK